MAINIKELFVTDLDPNSGAWWSKDKVDKINYNFYLLSNGGMPGPQGTIGVDGGFGPIGDRGSVGYQGPRGYQGYQGVGSLNDWEYFPEANGLPGYLYPRKNPINIAQSAPIALRIGYLSTDSEYEVGVEPQSPAQIVKTPDETWVNLRVENDSDADGYNFSFKSIDDKPVFEISPDITSTKFRIICAASNILFRTGTTINNQIDSITINDSQITINTGGITGPAFNLSNVSGKFTKSKEEFRFTPGAATNKVLISSNSDGDVEWKNVKDVFGTFPIGSIISIREDEFVTDHFWLNDSINVTLGSPLNNIYGRGKIGTDYEGWYLCNGETWETVEGFNQFLTPNLNNFSYTIDSNGDAQNLITSPETDPILIGGYDIRVSAIPNINGIYNVQYTTPFLDNNTSPGNSTFSMGTSGSYYTSRMIHIVYLENPNLKWTNNGVYVPPISTTEITLTLPLTTPLAIANQCTAPVTTDYSWTGTNVSEWNTFVIPSTNKLFNLGTTDYAPTGWYVNVDGYPIYWDGTDFTERGTTCDFSGTGNTLANFTYNLLVDGLNGPAGFTGDINLDIDTPLFIDATNLTWSDDQIEYPIGEQAPQGWYRESSTGVRRYWSGTEFIGLSFTENYVSRVRFDFGENDPGYNNSIPGVNVIDPETGDPTPFCELPQNNHLTYVVGNTNLTVPIISLTQHVKNYGSPLYVTLGWASPMIDFGTGEMQNTPPLINIKDQNRPGATSIYNKVYMDSDDYGQIVSTTGKIGTILSCS